MVVSRVWGRVTAEVDHVCAFLSGTEERGAWGGLHSFVACLILLPIDHAFLSRRSTKGTGGVVKISNVRASLSQLKGAGIGAIQVLLYVVRVGEGGEGLVRGLT